MQPKIDPVPALKRQIAAHIATKVRGLPQSFGAYQVGTNQPRAMPERGGGGVLSLSRYARIDMQPRGVRFPGGTMLHGNSGALALRKDISDATLEATMSQARFPEIRDEPKKAAPESWRRFEHR